MFRALTYPSWGGKIVFTQHLVSSLSVNVCPVHSVLCRRLQRAKIPDAVWIQFFLLGLILSQHHHHHHHHSRRRCCCFVVQVVLLHNENWKRKTPRFNNLVSCASLDQLANRIIKTAQGRPAFPCLCCHLLSALWNYLLRLRVTLLAAYFLWSFSCFRGERGIAS